MEFVSGVRDLSGWGVGSVCAEPGWGAGEELFNVVEVFTVEEGTALVVIVGRGEEIFPGPGGGTTLKKLERKVEIFPAGTGAVLGALGGGVGAFPARGAGAVLSELDVEVVVVFLVDDGGTVFPDVGAGKVFLVWGLIEE